MVAGEHIELVVAAQDGNGARVLRGTSEHLLIQRHIDVALIDIVAAVDNAGSIVGAKSKAVLNALEHFFEFWGGASAGGAEHDASLGELV